MDINSSARQLSENIRHDLGRKLVVITGARQAGKTTLARQLMADFEPAQYLNWDVPADRTLIAGNAWSPKARLVVFDEIHKMKDWKGFLKGAWDGRSPGQAMLMPRQGGNVGPAGGGAMPANGTDRARLIPLARGSESGRPLDAYRRTPILAASGPARNG